MMPQVPVIAIPLTAIAVFGLTMVAVNLDRDPWKATADSCLVTLEKQDSALKELMLASENLRGACNELGEANAGLIQAVAENCPR